MLSKKGETCVIHTRSLATVALSAMALVACSPKEAAKPKADASPLAGLPKPKAGLWEQTTTVGGGTLTNKVCLDDATSALTSIFLWEQEGTASSFRGLSVARQSG